MRAENNVDGLRMSTALTHRSCRHRLNLTIRARVLVRRILFSGTTAIGVEVDSAGEHFRIEGQDIVLSAGAVACRTCSCSLGWDRRSRCVPWVAPGAASARGGPEHA